MFEPMEGTVSNLMQFATALTAIALAATPVGSQESSTASAADEKAVRAAVDQWFVVLNAMFAGDPRPLAELYSHGEDATYMGAEGGYRIGWEAIYDDWKTQAEKSLGGEVHGEKIHVVVQGAMATATHYTKGTVKTAEDKVIDQRVRETSVFRKEGDRWKMVGHQADHYPVWAEVVDR